MKHDSNLNDRKLKTTLKIFFFLIFVEFQGFPGFPGSKKKGPGFSRTLATLLQLQLKILQENVS